MSPRFQVLISAPGSSHGKTVFTLLLLAWAKKNGLKPRAFKAGPDFIDPQYLSAVSGQAAPSLDPWFLSAPAMRKHFEQWSAQAGISVVEGVMGLYDGKRDEPFGAYSSAAVAKRLKLPVLIVLNARKAGPTLATQILGLQKADPKLKIVGVILNQAASIKTVQILAPAIRELCGVPVLGWLPSLPDLVLSERHLGLAAPSELQAWQRRLESVLPQVAQTVDFPAILKALKPYAQKNIKAKATKAPVWRFGLAVARDKAFHFYYPESLALLESLGAKLLFFSPLKDTRLPVGTQGLLVGGGFPEIFGETLARNKKLLSHTKQAIQAGLPTWAECGGLMWLAKTLTDLNGNKHSLVGALDASTCMTTRLQHFGYTTAKVDRGHAFLPQGMILRGHEFHHSQWQPSGESSSTWTLQQSGRASRPEGWRLPNGVATYFHSYFSASPKAARHFAKACLAHKGIS